MAIVWNTSLEGSPIVTDIAGYGYLEFQNRLKVVRERIEKEHYLDLTEGGAQPRQGLHRQGSAVTFYQAGNPTTRNSIALADADQGLLSYNTTDGSLYIYRGTSLGWETPLSGAGILAKLLLVDGTGSGLDADLLDGEHGSYYTNAGNLSSGTLLAARMPALTGDVTSTAGTVATTLVAASVLSKLLTVDGSGSGLDADLLDGQHGSYYTNAGNLDAGTILAARMPAHTGDVTSSAGSVALALVASSVLSKLLTVDGAGSSLDADLLDGQHGSYYLSGGAVSGTPNYVCKFTTSASVGDSLITDNGTLVVVTGSRPIALDSVNGNITLKASAGGWEMAYGFRGSSGTYRGGFGAFGSIDNLDSYYYIGPAYNTPYVIVNGPQHATYPGDVGIGVSPIGGAKLSVGGHLIVSKASGNDVRILLDQSGVVLWELKNEATSGTFRLIQGVTTSRISVSSGGLVGIGRDGVNDPLEVAGVISSYYSTTRGAFINTDSVGSYIGTIANHNLQFIQNNAEAGRIDTNKYWLLGHTTSIGAYKLQVTGSIYSSGNIGAVGFIMGRGVRAHIVSWDAATTQNTVYDDINTYLDNLAVSEALVITGCEGNGASTRVLYLLTRSSSSAFSIEYFIPGTGTMTNFTVTDGSATTMGFAGNMVF